MVHAVRLKNAKHNELLKRSVAILRTSSGRFRKKRKTSKRNNLSG